jgi:hypothetical protein
MIENDEYKIRSITQTIVKPYFCQVTLVAGEMQQI